MMKKMTALFLGMTLTFSLMACGNAESASSAASSSTDSVSAESDQTETTASGETSADAAESTSEETASSSASAEKSETAADTEATGESGKTLVVYYSASGNTKRVAEDIAEAAGADLFEIVPTEVYSDEDLNWRNSDSRVSREHDDESLRDVPLTNTEVENWDSYDTVFIGYPKMEYSL